MQGFDSIQQSPKYRKRRCIVYKPNDFFEAFDYSQHQIISNYQTSAQTIMIDSLTILINNIRNSTKSEINEPSSPKRGKKDLKQELYSLKKNLTFNKNENAINECDEQESTNPQRQIKEFVQFEKTGKKPQKSTKKIEYCLQEKGQQPNYVQTKKHQKLLNSLKRLTVSQEFKELQQEIQNSPQNNNRRDTDETDLLNFDMEAMKNKTISQLILDSNAKNKKNQNKVYSPIESQNSQYEMTDYSSNQSSNDDGDYEERFTFEDNSGSILNTVFFQGQPGKNFFLQGNMNQKSSIFNESVQHPPPKLNFKPLLDSPKKSKTKKKRLYINKKKVPRWASDRQLIAQQFGSQHQRNLREDANNIFGICIVEDMQTNTIFNRKDQYTRSSTVKWQRNKKYVV